jgi:hypothetical protein
MNEMHRGYLGSLPVDNPERPKLRDQVHGDHKRLAARTAKFLTRQSPCKPFESGANTLPGMEGFV